MSTEHDLRTIAHRRARCAVCRATWASPVQARRSRFSCPGEPVCHGPEPYDFLHYVNSGWHGGLVTDALCDEIGCVTCRRTGCACDVCRGILSVPALLTLIQDGHAGQFVTRAGQITDISDIPRAIRAEEGLEP